MQEEINKSSANKIDRKGISGLIDTHCHIHDSEYAKRYNITQDKILLNAKNSGVEKMICVGTSIKSSQEAVKFAKNHSSVCYASLALHPHEVADNDIQKLLVNLNSFQELLDKNDGCIVAIGECGLDYYYHQDENARGNQKLLLEAHLELANRYKLPVIFHVRDAFDDFFKVVDRFKSIKAVIHSFSASKKELEGCINRGFYIGLNGIMTFTKKEFQLEAAKAVPLERLLLETDAPFLTPAPFRGKMCEPKHIGTTLEFLADLRGENPQELGKTTTGNAKELFGLD